MTHGAHFLNSRERAKKKKKTFYNENLIFSYYDIKRGNDFTFTLFSLSFPFLFLSLFPFSFPPLFFPFFWGGGAWNFSQYPPKVCTKSISQFRLKNCPRQAWTLRSAVSFFENFDASYPPPPCGKRLRMASVLVDPACLADVIKLACTFLSIFNQTGKYETS